MVRCRVLLEMIVNSEFFKKILFGVLLKGLKERKYINSTKRGYVAYEAGKHTSM